MKLHRFLIDKSLKQPLGEELLIKESDLLHQWNNVLKFKIGEKIALFDGQQKYDFIYTIKDIKNKLSILTFDTKNKNISQKEELGEINLCISLVKKDKMSLIIEKCTEIGVLNFISLVSDRTERKNIESFNPEKMEKISKEAVEQSKWGVSPSIDSPKKMEKVIEDIKNKGEIEKIAILHTFDIKNSLNLEKNIEKIKELSIKYIFIGPEGGWSDKEVTFFEKNKLCFINFGKNILRTETSAIAASFLISIISKK